MQGFKTLVFLAVVMALLGLASAAPAEDESTGSEQWQDPAGLERQPALLVRAPAPAAPIAPAAPRSCTASACRSLCRSLGWNNGRCLDAVWCMCYN